MTPLLDALRQTLRAPGPPLLARGDRVLVAVSGGPDSLALLHALHLLREEIGLADVSAGHFHHGLRGPEADADAEFVRDFCAAHGIAFFWERGDVRADAARAHCSIQQAARAARYGFLERTAKAFGAGKVATGHTQDDQTETVLLHILRGTGTGGLRGIPPQRGVFVRPLLGITRAQVEEYCDAHALRPRRDTSNSDPSHYLRNRVRHELLPLLARDYAPGVRDALRRLSEIAGEDADFLHAHAQETLQMVMLAESISPPELVLSRAKLGALHPALARYVLRAALAQVRGTADGITHHHLMQIMGALTAPKRWGMTTPAPRCRVLVGGEAVSIVLEQSGPPAERELTVPLAASGSVDMLGSAWQVKAVVSDHAPAPTPGQHQAVFDVLAVDLPSLHVRTWRPGDRIASRGLIGHTKKLQDIFTDAKVPRAARAQVPLIADKDGLLWAAGLACSERGAVTPQTRQFLTLIALQPPPNRQ